MAGYFDMFKTTMGTQPVAPPKLIPTPSRSGVGSMWDWSSKSVQRNQDTNANNMRQYNLDMQHAKTVGQLGNVGGSGVAFGAGIPAVASAAPYSMTSVSEPKLPSYTNPYEQRLNSLLDNPDSISNTGAYKFRFNQGQQALERSAAARGMLGSGNTLAALAQYGQGMASQAYESERDALANMMAQRGQQNIGNRQADIGTYNAGTQRTGTLGELVLGQGRLGLAAQQAQADDYWKGQELALKQQLADQGSGGRGSSSSWGGVTQDLRGFW